MAKVTKQEIELIKALYKEIGTYAGVGRIVDRAPSTVKRYVHLVTDFTPTGTEGKLSKMTAPSVEKTAIVLTPDMLVLSEKEKHAIIDLRGRNE